MEKTAAFNWVLIVTVLEMYVGEISEHRWRVQ